MESEGDNSGEDAMNGSFHLIDLLIKNYIFDSFVVCVR
jgi:hypothetical protein